MGGIVWSQEKKLSRTELEQRIVDLDKRIRELEGNKYPNPKKKSIPRLPELLQTEIKNGRLLKNHSEKKSDIIQTTPNSILSELQRAIVRRRVYIDDDALNDNNILFNGFDGVI